MHVNWAQPPMAGATLDKVKLQQHLLEATLTFYQLREISLYTTDCLQPLLTPVRESTWEKIQLKLICCFAWITLAHASVDLGTIDGPIGIYTHIYI